LCHGCGRQFVEHPAHQPVGDATKQLIDKLLLEKIPLAGIARVVNVSDKWLQNDVNQKYASVPQFLDGPSKKKGD
jgi:insertion element IS1 protein InsB